MYISALLRRWFWVRVPANPLSVCQLLLPGKQLIEPLGACLSLLENDTTMPPFGCALLLFFRVVLAGFDLFDLSWVRSYD